VQIIQTEDGSPTVSLNAREDYAEPMHNRKGAFSETLEVYAPLIRATLASELPLPRIFSFGLGLGYVEWTAICEAIRLGKSPESLQIVSYESVDELKSGIRSFVESSSDGVKDLTGAYSKILSLYSGHYSLDESAVLDYSKQLLGVGSWTIEGAVDDKILHSEVEKFHCIIYDAFSSNFNSGPWNEGFLSEFLCHICDNECVFGTYASTGNLKRALLANDFKALKRPGFGGKRESTWAVKGSSLSLPQ
jgi:tRNA U34 5-methylaminomethyl-2-thiouridine-forming methyltransferase MnmC